jgi:hypothetical protein
MNASIYSSQLREINVCHTLWDDSRTLPKCRMVPDIPRFNGFNAKV